MWRKSSKSVFFYYRYSKWIEIWMVNAITTFQVVDKLQSCLATWGPAQEMASDKGPTFDSQKNYFVLYTTKYQSH